MANAESTMQPESPSVLNQEETLGADLGEIQTLDQTYSNKILQAIATGRTYYHEQVEPNVTLTRITCRNKHSNCAYWSVLGECENNPGYMKVNCPIVCQSCDQLQVENRCPLDPNAVDALSSPGDLNAIFERILADPTMNQFEPKVLSRPSYAAGDAAENATYILGPWMLQFENMVDEMEAERMIELGGIRGYERSTDVGARREDGTYDASVSSGRTSTNAWCVDDCYNDPVAHMITQRMENITHIPEANSENLQLLRYEHGQFYQTHNDYIPFQRERPTGVRILTFYVYLNDVAEGGGTNFPKLGLTVTPKRGRAVLWPSVLNEDPNEKDPRSDHQAMPVLKGIKYGANAWIHMRDFKEPNSRGC